MLFLQLWWSLVQKREWEAWCLVIVLLVKLSNFVLNNHSMNLEAFIVEYSPKLQIVFFRFEIWYDWLKLEILFENSNFF